MNDEGGMEQDKLRLIPDDIYKASLGDKDGKKWANVGIELWQAGRLDEARQVFRSALDRWPEDEQLWVLLGSVYIAMGNKNNEAFNCHREALRLKESALTHHGMAIIHHNMGHPSECLDHEIRALEIDPDFAPAKDGIAVAYQKAFQMPKAIESYRELLLAHPNSEEAISHLCLASIYMPETTPESLYVTHRYYGEVAENKAGEPPPFANSKDPNKKLRVGFFSGDFKKHSVCYFMEPLMRDLDRSKFEVYLYYVGTKHDEFTARCKAFADKWTEVRPQKAFVPQIRKDELDVAFDLGGHTSHHLTFFTHRIAPVQIVYMGYPAPTGLTRMDYRFTDELADPVGYDRWYTEKLVRLPGISWTYKPYENLPPVSESPHVHNGYITFGSFNNFMKMSDGQLRDWVRILDGVPGSKIIFKSVNMNDAKIKPRLEARLESLGFAGRATIYGGAAQTERHLEMYGLMDIALDPAPFNGATTTCEALIMGVPVLTIAGDRHAARVGVALLSAIGRPEWIASTPDELVQKAISFSYDKKGLAAIRRTLRGEFMTSQIMDYPTQARHFGDAIRWCWQDYCSKSVEAVSKPKDHVVSDAPVKPDIHPVIMD